MKRLFTLAVFIVLVYNVFCPRSSGGSRFVTSAEADLNGNGRVEQITVSVIPGRQYNFVLKIDEDSIKAKLFAGVTDGFIIVDIDTTDEYQEVAVHSPGPSADDEYLIFGYNGRSIKEMGRLSRWPKFFGDGIVIVEGWMMGFWAKKDKYILDKEKRSLELIPQEAYYVGLQAQVREEFSIYKARRDTIVVADLVRGNKVVILLYFPRDWYCIKSERGIVGWIRLQEPWNKMYLPAAD